MTGQQAKVVKGAYDAMVNRMLHAAIDGPRMDWDAFDAMRERQAAYIAARWRPYPRYDEMMAALRGER